VTADEERTVAGFARFRELASVVAPTTVVTALLFYFGYVATRSRFEYFGVYLDLTDLSTQNLLLYGLEVVYVPAALAFLAALLVVGVHGAVSWMLADRRRDQASLVVALAVALGGLLLVGRALVGMLVVEVEAAEVPGTTALALATGPVLLAYAAWIAGRVTTRRSPGHLTAWFASPGASRLRHSAVACVVGLVVAGLFWATNEFASAYGSWRAYDDALHLPDRPGVVLEAKEPINDPPEGVTVARGSQAFPHRYEGLRLLLASGGRLFLVPEHWTRGSRTIVVPYDGSVRMQLFPAAEPPE
jgi:hypothetical protein